MAKTIIANELVTIELLAELSAESINKDAVGVWMAIEWALVRKASKRAMAMPCPNDCASNQPMRVIFKFDGFEMRASVGSNGRTVARWYNGMGEKMSATLVGLTLQRYMETYRQQVAYHAEQSADLKLTRNSDGGTVLVAVRGSDDKTMIESAARFKFGTIIDIQNHPHNKGEFCLLIKRSEPANESLPYMTIRAFVRDAQAHFQWGRYDMTLETAEANMRYLTYSHEREQASKPYQDGAALGEAFATMPTEAAPKPSLKFPRSFGDGGGYVSDGDTITLDVDGWEFTARVQSDDDHGEPWKESDCHGIVSDWTSRDKRPGELVLASDRGSKRFYDFAETMRIAKRDGWDAQPYKTGTKGERAYRAVMRDFEAMRGWCADEWNYVGIVIAVTYNGIDIDDHAASLWGIECNYPADADGKLDNSYLTETANDLLSEAIEVAKKELATMRDKLAS